MTYTDKFGRACEYKGVPDDCHRGKVEFHHPIIDVNIGLDLCESHHSLARLQGYRKKRYPEEMGLDRSLDEIRDEVVDLVHKRVLKAGYKVTDINKS